MKNDLTTDPVDEALRSFMPMDPTEALRRLQVLVQSEPNLGAREANGSVPVETLKWLGQVQAVIAGMKLSREAVAMKVAAGVLVKTGGMAGADEVRATLYRALAAAELKAPASEHGAFIAAGSQLDAFAAISKVLAEAGGDLLVVDPYMDGKALADFMPSAAEGVTIRVLADEAYVKGTLAPAVERWAQQFGATRPLEARLTPARTLHDRLISVDGREIWSLSQSLKDFANRAHGSVLKVDPETAALKMDAYGQLWNAASPI